MLEAFFTGIFKCLWILGAAILGILYILSPLDIIPDVIPIIGWLDDLGVAGWLIKTLFSSIYRHIALWVLIIPGGVGLLAYLVSNAVHPLPTWGPILFGLPFMIFGFWKIGREID